MVRRGDSPRAQRDKVVSTRGRKLLAEAIDAEAAKTPRRTQRQLALAIDASEQSFWAWRAGTRRPGELMKARLKELLGIPMDAWLTADERKAFARARRSAA